MGKSGKIAVKEDSNLTSVTSLSISVYSAQSHEEYLVTGPHLACH